jgi:RNA polymerase sigma factor (sigma-70 family)
LRAACAEYGRLRAHFVERNLYLVIGMSAAYRTYGLPMMDLVQEANASLIRAVEKFDWRKDVRFQTYAAFWVRQAIERLITANRGIVRVPNYIQQKLRRLRREGKLPRSQREMDVRDVSQQFGLRLSPPRG